MEPAIIPGVTAAHEDADDISLVYTPTWIVAGVCGVIVLISLIFAHSLHFLGRRLKKNPSLEPLAEALQKVKEELMLLGFISLLLTVFQGPIQNICVSENYYASWLPCVPPTVHRKPTFWSGSRMLLSLGSSVAEVSNGKCQSEGKYPLMSLEAIHQLHIFIFVLAITHVLLSLITVVLGMAQMQKWKNWEDAISRKDTTESVKEYEYVENFKFIQDRFKGYGKASGLMTWADAFCKQFYGPINEVDYSTLRFGFIMKHCPGNPEFDFHKYMIRALQNDFQIVVELSWYLWASAILFMSLNVAGVHAYFWIGLLPLILLLTVGSKLEHIITEMAHKFAEKHSVITGQIVLTPSDDFFWFQSPRAVLVIIHFILFQNSFEVAIFFWILTTYGFDSCIMDKKGYIISRLIFSVITEVLCAYSTLPLYSIVCQMGNSFNQAIFDKPVAAGLLGWAKDAKKKEEGTSGFGGSRQGEIL